METGDIVISVVATWFRLPLGGFLMRGPCVSEVRLGENRGPEVTEREAEASVGGRWSGSWRPYTCIGSWGEGVFIFSLAATAWIGVVSDPVGVWERDAVDVGRHKAREEVTVL